jgi:hypothetical protein
MDARLYAAGADEAIGRPVEFSLDWNERNRTFDLMGSPRSCRR